MSRIQTLMNEILDDFKRPLYDQNFGMGLFDDEIFNHRRSLMPSRLRYIRPWRNLDFDDYDVSTLRTDNTNEFRVNIDVQQFKPEELNVQIVDDYLIVNGKHEERSDRHGFVSRQFTRRYKLPVDVDKSALVSNLSSDGILIMRAPKLSLTDKASNVVPITQTHAPVSAK